MGKADSGRAKHHRSTYSLAMANVGIWAIAMIAMVILMQDFPGVKKIYPILGGGIAVGIALISSLSRLK
ncbi:MAG: hypothetical protein V2I48_08520 [Xanthomonadales bacterium]|nr:hypothetical protein [Xanthomonadales bacterium]